MLFGCVGKSCLGSFSRYASGAQCPLLLKDFGHFGQIAFRARSDIAVIVKVYIG